MNLIEIYIHEVTRRLPEKNRDDIAMELESTIYDMLPEDYSDKDVNNVLESLGNPVLLASKYNEKPLHLIGPKYYDVYISLLKLVLPIVAIVSFISYVAVKISSPEVDGAVLATMSSILIQGLGNVFNALIQSFFWFTITFVIVERYDGIKSNEPLFMHGKKWTPDDLKYVKAYIPKRKKIRSFELYGALIWTAIWATTYFYADKLIGIYENFQLVIPAFNQELLLSYWFIIVILVIGEVVLTFYKLIQKQWTVPLAISYTAFQIASTIAVIFIFTRENLFTQAFLEKISGIFSTTPAQVESFIVWGVIVIFLVTTILETIDVFRRTKIKSDMKRVID